MCSEWEKTYIAIDLKSFYASVECVERGLDPLTTNLVVADAERTEKTICLAVTPSLKAYGLSGRSRLFEVVQKAREVERSTGRKLEYVTAVPRMALYIKYSADIYEIYLRYFSSEDIHIYSIDEVFIDVTNYLSFYKTDAESLTRKVVRDIFTETGITATAGIGSNLFLCKIAMDIVSKHIKPDSDGLRIAVLGEKEFRKTLWNHKPLTDFWRIGYGIATRLENNGMFTMGDIARRSLSKPGEESLYKLFGIDAEILIDHAWGKESCSIKNIKAYKSHSTSYGSGQVLHCPYSYKKARLIVKEMTEALVLDLVSKNLASSCFTLFIGYEALSQTEEEHAGETETDYYGRKMPKHSSGNAKLNGPSSSTKIIMEAVLSLYDRIAERNQRIKRLNICANDVVFQKEEIPDLFTDTEKLQKERRIQETILNIQKKYGKNSMLKGMDFEDGATTRDRNNQIGGHRA